MYFFQVKVAVSHRRSTVRPLETALPFDRSLLGPTAPLLAKSKGRRAYQAASDANEASALPSEGGHGRAEPGGEKQAMKPMKSRFSLRRGLCVAETMADGARIATVMRKAVDRSTIRTHGT